MAKLNLNKINDVEEYSDSTHIRGFRKGACINNSSEEIRMKKDHSFVSKRSKKEYAISLRQHEREQYSKHQAQKINRREAQESELGDE